MSAKMAASLLRIVRLGSTKCVQAERWSAPAAAALCTKAGGPKKPKKSSSGKKSQGKTYFDLEKLVPHRKYVEFPKKEMTPAAAVQLVAAPKPVEAAAAEPIVAAVEAVPAPAAAEAVPAPAAAEAVPAPAVVEATPVVDTVAPATEAIVESAALVAKATPVVEAAASVAEAAPVAAEAAPIFEASSAADTPVEAVPEDAAPAEAVAEAAPVEAAPVEVAPVEAIAEVLVESATIEAAAEALIEAVAEVVAEAAQVESAAEELIAEPPAEAERIEAPEVQLDPIQKLFLDSIREYSSKSVGGLVDAGPAYEKNLAEELTKLQRLYGGGDITAFPEFKFTEPKLEEVAPK